MITFRRGAGKTVATLLGLTATLPIDLALVGAALIAGRRETPAGVAAPRTVLITGGKMTKALQLARSFHAAGHRVVLVESPKYRLTGHRFSRSVDAFHCVPEPAAPGYAAALRDVVEREHVDVFVPVSSPAASRFDADAGRLLDDICDVVHADSDTVRMLDDKSAFATAAADMGLSVPHFARITDPAEIDEFEFEPGRDYVLKRIAYNPVGRMDLSPLRADTREFNSDYARSLPISTDDPWILQQFVTGREYCTHGTVRNGHVQVYACSDSSAFQVNYAQVDKPEIRSWVERFAEKLGATGQLSFDFIEADDGTPYAIECNPRTHSAITMFYDHPELAAAYFEDGHTPITPTASARPTYWIYHELWRMLTLPGRRTERVRVVLRGKDAIFAWSDPLPYLLVHHLQIPSLLVRNLLRGGSWSRIDFNIGKLVEDGGD